MPTHHHYPFTAVVPSVEGRNDDLVLALLLATVSPGIGGVLVRGEKGTAKSTTVRGLVDVLIPRGSAALINTVVEESKVPVIETGAGVVHVFIDESADPAIAAEVVVLPIPISPKTRRSG